MEDKKAKLAILAKYCILAQKKGFHPSAADLTAAGINRHKVDRVFGSHTKLKMAAKEHDPKAFKDIVDEGLFTPKNFKRLVQDAAKHDRYFLSTAVAGCDLHTGFFAAIENHNKRRDAMTIVLPSMDPAANVPFHLDTRLAGTPILTDDLGLNDNFFVSAIRLSAKHIHPLTGLQRIGQRNGSFVFASPKQDLQFTPVSNHKMPHASMTTGALTLPDYNTNRYMSERTAYIADHDHIMGGVIVEVVNDTLFHFRQVQADKKGAFIDLGIQYNPDGTTKVVRPEALSLGDWHAGETDAAARKAFIDAADSVLNVTKPKRLILHDAFNGLSISHHDLKDKILRAQRSAANQLNLGAELEALAKDLDAMCSVSFIEEVVIAYSNHNEFLYKYLADGKFVEDPKNLQTSLRLALACLIDDNGKVAEPGKGQDPVKAYMDKRGVKNGHKLRWLKVNEDYRIAGVECGAHGHLGMNGSRGNIQAMEAAYGNSISGHDHTPGILRGAYKNGTLQILDPAYRKGPTSWMHSSTLLYSTGARQIINCVFGKWRK